MAHTPGPWMWVEEEDTGYWRLQAENGEKICDDGSAWGEYNQEIDPHGDNARLIAAAVNSYDRHCGERAAECAEADLLGDLLAASRAAAQFIRNGVELGYIRLPDAGDPALDTLPLLDAAIARAARRALNDELRAENTELRERLAAPDSMSK